MSQPTNSSLLSFRASLAVIIGSIIGAGLFMKPASMAAQLGSPLSLSLIWVVAGFFTLCGALVYAELGAMMPQTGGLFVHFRNIFGNKTAFLYGWSAFAVINTASVAAIAFVCASYMGKFIALPELSELLVAKYAVTIPWLGKLFPLRDIGVKTLAILLVCFLTWLNTRSLKAGSWFQLMTSSLNMGILLLLVVGIFISDKGSVRNFYQSTAAPVSGSLLTGWVAAMTGAFFAYDGWVNIVSMAGEVKDPQRNIPRSLWTGVLVCIVMYLLVNQAYLYVLPIEKMSGSVLVASDAIGQAWGYSASLLVALMIIAVTFGCVNGNIMATSRITYAMGKEGVFASWAGKTHPQFQTPGNALWLHGTWTSLLILTGSFDLLADMFVFVTWIAYAMGAIGIIYWRIKYPEKNRPYKIWGHPFTTIAFVSFSLFYLGATIYKDVQLYHQGLQPVINSLLGLCITLLGLPVYFYYRKKNKGRSI